MVGKIFCVLTVSFLLFQLIFFRKLILFALSLSFSSCKTCVCPPESPIVGADCWVCTFFTFSFQIHICSQVYTFCTFTLLFKLQNVCLLTWEPHCWCGLLGGFPTSLSKAAFWAKYDGAVKIPPETTQDFRRVLFQEILMMIILSILLTRHIGWLWRNGNV